MVSASLTSSSPALNEAQQTPQLNAEYRLTVMYSLPSVQKFTPIKTSKYTHTPGITMFQIFLS